MPISVVFLGTSAFAVPSLRALATDERFRVELVITQPDRPTGRKHLLTPPPVKTAAAAYGIPILQPERVGDARSAIPPHDVLVVVSYGQLLPQEILDMPKIFPVNVHASLLPSLRGASPIQHAILQHLPITGVTVQRMVQELDAGPILGHVTVAVDARDTTPALHDRLAAEGATLLVNVLTHPWTEEPQDHGAATHCRKLTREDGKADPTTMDAAMIDRMVRALTPWPGVTIRGTKILQTSLTPDPEALTVPCAQGTTLYITRLQPPAGTPMTGATFARGRTL